MLTGKVYGIEEVLENLDKAKAEIVKKLYDGVNLAALATESHIKKEYRRPVTGKGFSDPTGTLRRSIGSHTVYHASKDMVIGYVFAGTFYAVYVEFRWGGQYAYLWPGVIGMKEKIWQIIKETTKGAFK